MRVARTIGLAALVVVAMLAAACSAPNVTTSTTSTSTPTAGAVPTAPVGPMLGSETTAMPDVIGLNLHIAAERFVGIGQGARLFTDKVHGIYAKDVYGVAIPPDIGGDPAVTTSSPAPGAPLHGDNLYLATGPLQPRSVNGKTVGPWYFSHGNLVRTINDEGCWGCHDPDFCRRCHPGYKVGTAGLAHPPVTVESVVRKKVADLYPDGAVKVSRVLVSGTDGYAVYLVYKDPAAATSHERPAAEKRLAEALAVAKLRGVRSLKVIWIDSEGGIAASDDVPIH